jgi:hypothetical protein
MLHMPANAASNARSRTPPQEESENASYGLRYYAPSFDRKIDNEIRELLREICRIWNLRCDIEDLRLTPSKLTGQLFPDSAHEEEIYKRDFLPRKGVLKTRSGASLREQLRSNSGRFNLAGAVVIVSGRGIEWLCPAYGRDSQFGLDSDARLDFLKASLQRGPAFLHQLCPPIGKSHPEARLLDLFLTHRVLDGEVRREVPIGSRRFSTEFGNFDWRKAIDLVIDTADSVWIIEAKPRLNCEAMGQVLLYGDLYEQEHDATRVKLGILCGELEGEILLSCHKRRITVFQVTESGVEVLSYDQMSQAPNGV